jgi:hypothetical protein
VGPSGIQQPTAARDQFLRLFGVAKHHGSYGL